MNFGSKPHAALDENLRHKDAIDRFAEAADEAREVERSAARDLFKTKPATTMAAASARIDYPGTLI